MGKQGEHGISWTDVTWNPVTGCTKVSKGCTHCYAERMHGRFGKEPFSKVMLHLDRLNQPLHWKKPRRVFVCSMGDLFHEDVDPYFINRVFYTIQKAKQHRFQILTKRPKRMLEHLKKCEDSWRMIPRWVQNKFPFPLPNVWLGVSVEDQKTADERVPLLLQTPAAVRYLSIEPMLGPVDLSPQWTDGHVFAPLGEERFISCSGCLGSPVRGQPYCPGHNAGGIDWVIVGAETGPGARTMDIEWARSLVDQCRAAGVPIHIKQITINGKVSKNMDEWPEDLRIREFPK